MKRFRIGLALLALALAPSAARAEQLLVNGGFETGDFTGWTQSGNTGTTSVWGISGVAHSGNYAAALGPVGSLGYLTQTFSTTPGTTLYLNFYLASDGALPNSFAVMLAGLDLQLSNLPTQPYKLYSLQTIATNPTTTLTLGFQNDPGFLLLDDVSVTTSPTDPTTWPTISPNPIPGLTPGLASLPEPSTLALVAIGAVGLLCGRRWRRRTV